MSYPNTKEMNESMYSKGTFAVGVHKRNVAPQNHFSKKYFEWPLHLQKIKLVHFFFIR